MAFRNVKRVAPVNEYRFVGPNQGAAVFCPGDGGSDSPHRHKDWFGGRSRPVKKHGPLRAFLITSLLPIS